MMYCCHLSKTSCGHTLRALVSALALLSGASCRGTHGNNDTSIAPPPSLQLSEIVDKRAARDFNWQDLAYAAKIAKLRPLTGAGVLFYDCPITVKLGGASVDLGTLDAYYAYFTEKVVRLDIYIKSSLPFVGNYRVSTSIEGVSAFSLGADSFIAIWPEGNRDECMIFPQEGRDIKITANIGFSGGSLDLKDIVITSHLKLGNVTRALHYFIRALYSSDRSTVQLAFSFGALAELFGSEDIQTILVHPSITDL